MDLIQIVLCVLILETYVVHTQNKGIPFSWIPLKPSSPQEPSSLVPLPRKYGFSFEVLAARVAMPHCDLLLGAKMNEKTKWKIHFCMGPFSQSTFIFQNP